MLSPGPGRKVVSSPARQSQSRIDVLGVGVSITSLPSALADISEWVRNEERQYVCVTNVHTVMECQRDAELRRIHNASGLTVPDGRPIAWSGRLAGVKGIRQVRGADLLLAVLRLAEREGWSSFFYGGSSGTPELLVARLRERFPALRVAGAHSPPFRPLTAAEEDEVVQMINESGADLVWVGLSAPKQEKWMGRHRPRLNPPVLLGVGAAFDFHSGAKPQAPRWVQRLGLEWFHRLITEPRRLWRRYLINNPLFVAKSLVRRPRVRAASELKASRMSPAAPPGGTETGEEDAGCG